MRGPPVGDGQRVNALFHEIVKQRLRSFLTIEVNAGNRRRRVANVEPALEKTSPPAGRIALQTPRQSLSVAFEDLQGLHSEISLNRRDRRREHRPLAKAQLPGDLFAASGIATHGG